MPASSINDPEHWRARAEEMRRLAEDINDARNEGNDAAYCARL